MPIIKVSSTDLSKPKLIAVNDLKSLKEKAEAKLGFEIDKFIRKSDGSEVDDDDVLNHLFTEEKELWLVCLANGQEYSLETQINQDDILKTMQDLLTKAKNESINNLIRNSIRSEPDHVASKVIDTSSDEKEDLPFQENPVTNNIRISQTILPKLNEEKNILKTIQDLITDKKSSIRISTSTSRPVLIEKQVDSNESSITDEEVLNVDLFNNNPKDEILKSMQDIMENSNNNASKVLTIRTSSNVGNPLNIENNILKSMQDIMEKTNSESITKFNSKEIYGNNVSKVITIRTSSNVENPLNIENNIIKSMQDLIAAKNESIKNLIKNSILNSSNEFSESLTRRITRPVIEEENSEILKNIDSILNNPDPVEFSDSSVEIITPINQQEKIISNLFNQMIKAEKVDLCFMIDCTGSMKPYIDKVKSTLNNIVNKLKLKFSSFELRLSFVGYRDHFDQENRVTYLKFVDNIETFQEFLSNIKAKGGQDQAEDVIGGLEQVNKLEWINPTRVLFHIGDAPQHGLRFHEANITDDFPGGDPRNVNLTKLFKDLIAKQINYYFAEINTSTVKMIQEFNNEIIRNHGKKIKKFKLSSVDDLTALIARTINASINETKKITKTMDEETKKLELNNVESIDWTPSDSNQFDKFNAVQHLAKYNGQVNELKTKPIDYTEKPIEILIAKQPFDKGSLRYAFAALVNVGTSEKPNYVKSVVKQTIYKAKEFNDIKYYKDIIENQVIASYLAKKFFDITKPEKSIRFIDVSLIYVSEKNSYYTLEEYIDGDFVKWISNDGTINQDIYSCTLDAFSHWSYIISKKYLLVTDLQGALVANSNYILTDPAITSPESPDRFTNTNLGEDGIERFFKSHQCNHICKYLVLEKHELQELPDRTDFDMMTKLMTLKPFETA